MWNVPGSQLSDRLRMDLKIFIDKILVENRKKTFKNWPYKMGSCTASNMAEAGFYQISKYCVKCAFCDKELDGWEEEDIPMVEHEKHSGQCPMVAFKKTDNGHQITVREAMTLMFKSYLLKQRKQFMAETEIQIV